MLQHVVHEAVRHVRLLIACVCVKVLLGVGYASTDFEVHRAWGALAVSAHPSAWYTDTTSVWTVDYPPAFMWAQRAWALVARALVPEATRVSAEPVMNSHVLAVQRASVIATDVALYVATCALAVVCKQYFRYVLSTGVRLAARVRATAVTRTCKHALFFLHGSARACARARAHCCSLSHDEGYVTRVLVSCMLCFGLLMVDGIHFQYNGYLLSLFFVCLTLMYTRRLMAASAAYTLLILSKHLFLAAGPVIAIFLVAAACESATPHRRAPPLRIVARLTGMASAVVAVILATCWPWMSSDARMVAHNAAVIASRLFPFQRGLVHAYWAPNVWALYLSVDKLAAVVARRVGLTFLLRAGAGVDGLLAPSVQASHSAHVALVHTLQVLPQPTAVHCIVIVLLVCVPIWCWLARRCTPARAHVAACVCLLMFFAFGFHTQAATCARAGVHRRASQHHIGTQTS
ncbi:hypothetical protein EON67_08030, partial [archaeon]